jgi:hypothetical protein
MNGTVIRRAGSAERSYYTNLATPGLRIITYKVSVLYLRLILLLCVLKPCGLVGG